MGLLVMLMAGLGPAVGAPGEEPPARDAASPSDRHAHGHGSRGPPYDVLLAMPAPPPRGQAGSLHVTVATAVGAPDTVVARITVPGGITVLGPAALALEGVASGPRSGTFDVLAEAHGRHILRVEVEGTDARGAFRAARHAYLDVGVDGASRFHLDHYPVESHVIEPLGTEESDDLLGLASLAGGMLDDLPAEPPPRPGGEAAGRGDGDADGIPAPEPDGTVFRVRGCIWASDDAAAGPGPLPWVWWTLIEHKAGSWFLPLQEGYTGGDGCFTSRDLPFTAATPSSTFSITYRFCNWLACVKDDGLFRDGTYRTGTTLRVAAPGQAESLIGVDHIAPRVLLYAGNTWNYAVNIGGLDIGRELRRVTIYAPDDSCDGADGCYGDSTIWIDGKGDRDPPLVAHEYGHHIMREVYGDIFPGGDHPACPGTRGALFAWSEGWSNFLGAVATYLQTGPGTRTGEPNYRGWNFETYLCPGLDQRDEMNVAGALLDLVDDTPEEALDPVSVPVSHVFRVMTTGWNHKSLREFYEAPSTYGPASYAALYGRCDFVKAVQPRMPWNQPPTATLTSPSGGWHASPTLRAQLADLECVPEMMFRLTRDSWCDDWQDQTPDSDPASAWLTGAGLHAWRPPAGVPDGWYRTCAWIRDGLGSFPVFGPSFGLDGTSPWFPAPALSGLSGVDGWWRGPVRVSAPCTDAVSGVAATTYQWQQTPVPFSGSFLIAEELPHTTFVVCTDAAGNAAMHSVFTRIDTQMPVVLYGLEGNRSPTHPQWFRSDVGVSSSCSDQPSGVYARETLLNGAPVPHAFLIWEEGLNAVRLTCKDFALNTRVVPVSVPIDKTPPTTTATLSPNMPAGAWSRLSVRVELRCADLLSACWTTSYRVGPSGSFAPYTGAFHVSAQGETTVSFQSTDRAGNQEAVRQVVVRVDSRAPVTDVALSGPAGDDGWYAGPVTLTLSCSDGDASVARSGCSLTRYSTNGGASFGTYVGPFTLTELGAHRVCVKSIDGAGNEELAECGLVRIHGATQRWWLGADPHPQVFSGNKTEKVLVMRAGARDPSLAGTTVTVGAGACLRWAADSAPFPQVNFAAGPWLANLPAPSGGVRDTFQHQAAVGVERYLGGFSPRLTEAAAFDRQGSTIHGTLKAAGAGFPVAGPDWLGFRFCNEGSSAVILRADGSAWVRAPAGSETYPGGT